MSERTTAGAEVNGSEPFAGAHGYAIGYPRSNNGHTDAGKRLNERECPNCNSTRFIETVSVEQCPDCGLQCDYWGSGPNTVYLAYMHRKAEAARILNEEQCELA